MMNMPIPLPEGFQPPMQNDLGLTNEEMKQNLQDLRTSAENKMRDVFAKKFQIDNLSESKRQETLKAVLEMMQKMGVNVHDPASVQEFLGRIQESNPDMYEIVVEILNTLMSGEEAPPIPEGEIPLEGAPEVTPEMRPPLQETPMNISSVPGSLPSPQMVPPQGV